MAPLAVGTCYHWSGLARQTGRTRDTPQALDSQSFSAVVQNVHGSNLLI